MVERTTGRAAATRRHPVQTAAVVVGAVFLLVGVLGFIPGVTTNYDQLSFGHDSGALFRARQLAGQLAALRAGHRHDRPGGHAGSRGENGR